MAFEHCSGSVNPVVTDLVKSAVTPRLIDRRSAPQMLEKTPPELRHSHQSHQQSGVLLSCCSDSCQKNK